MTASGSFGSSNCVLKVCVQLQHDLGRLFASNRIRSEISHPNNTKLGNLAVYLRKKPKPSEPELVKTPCEGENTEPLTSVNRKRLDSSKMMRFLADYFSSNSLSPEEVWSELTALKKSIVRELMDHTLDFEIFFLDPTAPPAAPAATAPRAGEPVVSHCNQVKVKQLTERPVSRLGPQGCAKRLLNPVVVHRPSPPPVPTSSLCPSVADAGHLSPRCLPTHPPVLAQTCRAVPSTLTPNHPADTETIPSGTEEVVCSGSVLPAEETPQSEPVTATLESTAPLLRADTPPAEPDSTLVDAAALPLVVTHDQPADVAPSQSQLDVPSANELPDVVSSTTTNDNHRGPMEDSELICLSGSDTEEAPTIRPQVRFDQRVKKEPQADVENCPEKKPRLEKLTVPVMATGLEPYLATSRLQKQCWFCQFKFDTSSELERHLKKVFDDKDHSTDLMMAAFNLRSARVLLLNERAELFLKCLCCDQVHNKLSGYIIHHMMETCNPDIRQLSLGREIPVALNCDALKLIKVVDRKLIKSESCREILLGANEIYICPGERCCALLNKFDSRPHKCHKSSSPELKCVFANCAFVAEKRHIYQHYCHSHFINLDNVKLPQETLEFLAEARAASPFLVTLKELRQDNPPIGSESTSGYGTRDAEHRASDQLDSAQCGSGNEPAASTTATHAVTQPAVNRAIGRSTTDSQPGASSASRAANQSSTSHSTSQSSSNRPTSQSAVPVGSSATSGSRKAPTGATQIRLSASAQAIYERSKQAAARQSQNQPPHTARHRLPIVLSTSGSFREGNLRFTPFERPYRYHAPPPPQPHQPRPPRQPMRHPAPDWSQYSDHQYHNQYYWQDHF